VEVQLINTYCSSPVPHLGHVIYANFYCPGVHNTKELSDLLEYKDQLHLENEKLNEKIELASIRSRRDR